MQKEKNFVASVNNSSTNHTHSSRNELIPIFRNITTDESVVDARELHKRLKIQTQFSKWIQRRIQEYDFQEGLDFYPNLTKSTFGRPTIEYHITTIMAQELCILDNSEIGKAIRLYLLQNLKDSHNKPNILKDLVYLNYGDRHLYLYRDLQRKLGFSTKSSIANVRRKYSDQLFVHARVAWVTEEYALLMISRAETREIANRTLTAKTIASTSLSQLNLFN